ncbi:MAG TPA: type VII secretion target [Pilimelia sp.]|nr:type VII secretion target [Pilimelia sp.]
MVRVDPQRLRAVAAKVEEAAKTAATGYSSRAATLAPVAGQVAGWSAAAAARSAATTWGAFVERLSAAMSGLGKDMTTAATRYETADQESAQRVNRAGRRFE